jgi:hypothetical protein
MTLATWTTSKSSPLKSMSITGTGSAGPIRFPRTIGANGKSDTRDPSATMVSIRDNSSSMAAAKSSAVPRAMHVHRSSKLQKVQRLRSIFRWRACLCSPPEVTISVENIPPKAHAATLWVAVTERGLASNVLRGENEGRNLTHAAVLRSLTQLRAQQADAGSAKATNPVALDPSWKRENLRFVVFLQEPKTLHIFGAVRASISH